MRGAAPPWSARRWCAVLVATLMCAQAAVAFAADVVRISEGQMRALGVETVTPRPQPTGEVSGLPAQVIVPNQQLRVVSTPLAGVVEELLVATPQEVRKGQPMVRLQSPGLAELQQTYLQAATRLQLSRTQLERDEQLFAEGIAAESRVQATRARWTEVSADYAERTQALRLAGMSDASIEELRSGRRVGSTLQLVAPIDGVVLEQLVTVGQRVEGATALLKIGRLDPLWLEIQVPVARIAAVRMGARVTVPSLDADARVIAIGRNIGAANQTVTVRALTTRGAQRLLPGQSVEAMMATASEGGDWNLPNAAITREGGVASVFVRTPEGFRRTQVRVVSEGAERSVVAGPLGSGDEVAVRGVAALKSAAAMSRGN